MPSQLADHAHCSEVAENALSIDTLPLMTAKRPNDPLQFCMLVRLSFLRNARVSGVRKAIVTYMLLFNVRDRPSFRRHFDRCRTFIDTCARRGFARRAEPFWIRAFSSCSPSPPRCAFLSMLCHHRSCLWSHAVALGVGKNYESLCQNFARNTDGEVGDFLTVADFNRHIHPEFLYGAHCEWPRERL